MHSVIMSCTPQNNKNPIKIFFLKKQAFLESLLGGYKI